MGAGAALLPVVAWLVTVLLMVALAAGLQRPRRARLTARARQRGARDRVLARMVLCAAAWTVVGAVWILGQLLAGGGPVGVLSAAGVSTAGGGAFTWVRRLLSRQASKPSGGRLSVLGKRWVLQALAYVTLGAAVATVASGLVLLTARRGALWRRLGAAIVAGICLLFSLTVDPHEIGFHAFYRSRLVRAYLGASNSRRSGARRRSARATTSRSTDLATGRPLHLVCCAANDLAGDPSAAFTAGRRAPFCLSSGSRSATAGDRWRTRRKGTRPWGARSPLPAPPSTPTWASSLCASVRR